MLPVISNVSLFLYLVLFIRTAESRPSFTATPPDPFYVLEGNNITFVWQYNLDGTFDRLVFQFSGSSPTTILIKHDINLDAVVSDSTYQGRIQENINATRAEITIFALRRNESGGYEIDLTNKNFQSTSDRVTVQAQYPPEFNNVSSDVVVVEDDPSITLECIADGEPTPNIAWTKVYANGSDSGVLGTGNQFVLETNRNNSGKYRCTANNRIGTAPNHTVKVEVNYKPENVKLMVNDSIVCEGDVISITCSADGKPAVHTYQLFENGIPVNDGNSSAGVWMRKDLKGGDLSYRCVANNTVGTSEKTLNVTVKVPSKVYPLENITVIEGENKTLTCNVSGSPVLTVTWTEVSSGSKSSGVMRYLTNISRNNDGEYKCEAANDCGSSSASTFLTVLYKPENVQLMSSAIEDKACTGEVISFNCSANANPGVMSYQLFESETAILNTSASGMWSKTLESGGVFVYKCVANNSIGSEYSMSITVTVNVPSSITQITQEQNITEGCNVTLSCQVSGVPTPTVSWIKSGGQRYNGHMLEVKHINRTQRGKYKCEASNECGNATKTATINVQYKPENVQLMSSAMNNKACTGKVISFNCSANANPEVTSYQLLENKTAILNTIASRMWNKTLESEGIFVFKCVANNFLGSEYSMSVTVTVNVPSSIVHITQDQNVTEGHNVTLMCNVSGIPPPMVSWITPDSQRVSGYKLKVTNINRTQAGEYICEASNECGNATEMATIIVLHKPENVQLKTSIMDNKACKGDMIGFNCSAYARPSVTSYQLFENDTAILDANPSGMWKRNVLNGGVFTYKCMANNSLGTEVSPFVMVTVNVPSSLQVIDDKKVFEGDNVTLLCRVSGMPSPVVSWMTPNGQRRSGYVLEVKSINRSQAGEYKCEAINECGNATKTASIHVQFKWPGNPCLVKCTNGQACREFGKHLCLCPKWKKGKDCKEDDTVATVIMISLKINNKKWREELTDLSDLDTQLFVGTITRSVDEEFKGSGVREINVMHLRKGSVIADISLTFDEPVGESEVESLLLDVINNGSVGNLKVDTFSVGSTISDSVTVPGPVPSEPAKVNKDVIYGSVIGVLASILAVIIIFTAWKRRKREKDDRLDTGIKESRKPYFNEGFELESSNRNLSTVLHHGPGHYMDLNEVRSLNEPATGPARSYLEINEYAPLHPGTRSWEVERQNVTIEKVIGKGAFGQVAQGKTSNLRGSEETMTVAIKMLKGNATDTERKDLLSELEVMKKLKPHPHVIRLLGCVTESDPLLVLIEYVPYGDLLGYLRKSRQLEDNYFKDPDIKPQTSLTSQQLMKFSWQVADGMHYLSSKNIIHRDLAARNVLVGERERCKVTDFGMARDVCQENIYERKSKGRLPVKWTACEALLYGRYTTKSDVWSFGIVLYEIFTIGGSPYPRIQGRKMADLLTQGYRMPKPRHVEDTLYKIMQDCWQENPDDRPMFENLRNDLKEMENQHQKLINMQHYDNILYASMD